MLAETRTTHVSPDGWRAEQTRLVREATLTVNAERRTVAFALQHTISLVAFGLAPSVPGARILFGATSTPMALASLAPGMLGIWVSLLVYRSYGIDSRVYRLCDAVETTLHYGVVLALIYESGLACSILWGLVTPSAVFFANTKPFQRALHGAVIAATHLALLAALLARGDARAAWISAAFGLVALLSFVVMSRRNRRVFALEARSNVLRARLNEMLLEREREQVAVALREGVGREIEALARELESGGAAQARTALAELGSIAHARRSHDEPRGIDEVAQRVDEKCRSLCAGLDYALSLAGGDDRLVDPSAALAVLRVAQELVRNAVTHGKARVIRVTLTARDAAVYLVVRDDGLGLSPEALARATGGLRNAQNWVGERGGRLELAPSTSDAQATELHAIVPDAFAAR